MYFSTRWVEHYLAMCNLLSHMSKDEKTQVGAVIVGPDREVLSTGFNGFPRKVNDDVPARHERPAKYTYFEHGERNAIYNAARNGVRVKGTTLFINAPPCSQCARGIIQSGIIRIIYPKFHAFINRPDWEEDIAIAREMMEEAEIKIFEHDPS